MSAWCCHTTAAVALVCYAAIESAAAAALLNTNGVVWFDLRFANANVKLAT